LGHKTRIDSMKTNTVQTSEAFRGSSVIPILSPVVILLMFYSLRWSAVLGAALFTVTLCSSPSSFRTRGGSLVLAICLAVFVWLSAAVTFALSLF
jgi:hypothetical protein